MAGEATIERHSAAMARLQDLLAETVRRAWRAVPDVSDASAERWLAIIVPVVAGAQLRASTLTSVYLAELLTEMGAPTQPAPVAPELVAGAATRRGTAPAVVYQRPITEVRALLANGLAATEALRRAERRAVTLAATDLQLARTHTARQVLDAQSRVVGYRRVLSGQESCGLCVVATTQRYRTADLMPIHPGCDCTVAPIVGTEDPGRVINQPLLDDLHQSVEERFGPEAATLAADSPAYRELVAVDDHGEYGPTLTVARHGHLTETEALARS